MKTDAYFCICALSSACRSYPMPSCIRNAKCITSHCPVCVNLRRRWLGIFTCRLYTIGFDIILAYICIFSQEIIVKLFSLYECKYIFYVPYSFLIGKRSFSMLIRHLVIEPFTPEHINLPLIQTVKPNKGTQPRGQWRCEGNSRLFLISNSIFSFMNFMFISTPSFTWMIMQIVWPMRRERGNEFSSYFSYKYMYEWEFKIHMLWFQPFNIAMSVNH